MVPSEWPPWLEAIGTVGAFGVALSLLSIQIRDRREDRRTSQARFVAAWWADTFERPQPDGAVFFELTVGVKNGSDQPVYSVVVRTEVGVRGAFVNNLDSLGPGEERELSVLAPGYPRGVPGVSISFRDATGKDWLRSSDGQLKAASGPDLIRHQTESPGAYDSVDAHPTLGLNRGWERGRGRRAQ